MARSSHFVSDWMNFAKSNCKKAKSGKIQLFAKHIKIEENVGSHRLAANWIRSED
jgi:mRNA-degrading endonuclease YafQ of YafQ-DinJ toxin-antitoxin module